MKNNSNTDNKVGKVLESLDNLEKMGPQPFFYTRLMARINKKENKWERCSTIVLKPVIIIACICLVLLMNIAAIYYNKHSSVLEASQNELVLQDELTQLSTNFYDLENVKP